MSSNASQKILQLYKDTELLRQRTARQEINAFVEYVGKDESGRKVIQAAIHKEIQGHIDECKRLGFQNCGILAPWGHGKTEQVSIFRSLSEIGKNPNIRIQVICNTDDNSTARVTTIAKYIEQDPDYHEVYPEIKPANRQGDAWGSHKLVVERSNLAKDGTVESWGITTSGTGSRADLQIFDDPVDLRNAILNPAMRVQVKEAFKNVWLSRLVPGGFRVYIATVWHEDDLTADLRRDPAWKFLVMKVSEDFKSIECDSALKGQYTIPLWEIWNEKNLRGQFKLLRERAYNRGYRQEAISDEDRTFPSSERIFRVDLGDDCIAPHWPRVMGIDPFGQNVVLFTVAYEPLRFTKFFCDIRMGKLDPKRTVTEIIEAWKRWQHAVIVCENNAAQSAIMQWCQEVGGPALPIIPFVTGSQKADPELGLPSLEVEFANGSWIVPYRGIDELDGELPVNVWRKELRGHPIAAAADTVMASWFAREGVRYLTRHQEQKEEIVVGQDIAPEAYEEDGSSEKIGDY